ncbi:rhamnogalacturonan acetylesterase [bacterium]|nr:rhamnogalacturonan acetylesterase [bacterium]
MRNSGIRVWPAFSLLFILLSCMNDQPPVVYLIGDSTVADKPVEGNPERGWGQLLPQFFTASVKIRNHAVNGRSTRSFIDEGRWDAVLDSLSSGDYVFVQFGHNDQKDYDTTRYAAPHGAYNKNLIRFINESRMKDARPVLVTPVMRRRFDEKGQFYDTHGEYPDVVRELADSLQVPLVDLHQSSRKLIEEMGEEDSKKIFLWIGPGLYARLPEGKEDNTHFSEYGATQIAGLVVRDIIGNDLKLKNYLITP